MEDLFSILIVIFIWSLIGASMRKAVKGTKGRQQSAKKQPAAPEKDPVVNAGSLSASSDASHRHAAPDWGSLGGSSSEGMDPCHDDPYAMPLGSLAVDHPEGVDPCHDDPYATPLGSLAADHPEGTDPCHPALRPDLPASGISPASAPEASGLRLGFSGNEIVQGFVWGEILNRKRA